MIKKYFICFFQLQNNEISFNQKDNTNNFIICEKFL